MLMIEGSGIAIIKLPPPESLSRPAGHQNEVDIINDLSAMLEENLGIVDVNVRRSNFK